MLLAANPAWAEAGSRTMGMLPGIWWLAPIGSILALVFAYLFYKEVIAADEGTDLMKEIAAHVREGAYAYLWRQYRVVTIVFIGLSVVLAIMAFVFHAQHKIVPFAFLTGGFFSGLAGFIGMKTATSASARTTEGARNSLNRGLQIAFRSGAVMGLVVVGLGLIDICGWFLGLYGLTGMSLNEITVVMLCFGMGASTQALFARVGGGIYTKAADVGADLVGKVEAGIPEDDPRNPATIADNVGDNVGDVAGMGADLYESYCGSILATAALGVAAITALGYVGEQAFDYQLKMLALPMVLAGAGIILSIIGVYLVRTGEEAKMGELLKALFIGILVPSALILVAAWPLCSALLGDIEGVPWRGVWGAATVGMIAGLIIGWFTTYYTAAEYRPTRRIAEQAVTGPATVIISGVAEGMMSTWASLLTVIVATMMSFMFAGGGEEFALGLYGVGIAAVAMLSTLGVTLATDAYGPIADNAGGNAEMSGLGPEVRERTDALDSLGNTTAATGKGFAIGSAALTALALLAAYVEEVRVGQIREAHSVIMMEAEDTEVGKAFHLGAGKFAYRVSDGKGEQAADCLMVLEGKEHILKLDRTTQIEPKSKGGDSNLLTATVSGNSIELVPARTAKLRQYMAYYEVTLMNPKVLCGIFAGVLAAFTFCSMTMQAVGRAAGDMMLEARRQFGKIRDALRAEGKSEEEVLDPGTWPRRIEFEGQQYPDYASCVSISTAGAQKEMVVPALLAIAAPVVVGLFLGVPGVMGLLAGGLSSGFAVAVFMANAGGAWDNAKKYIETFGKVTAKDFKENPDQLKGKVSEDVIKALTARAESMEDDEILYGKGSEDHKAGVVGDTVGDPFKDTSGPSLNILIKLMSMVSVVFAGLIVKAAPKIAAMIGLF